MGLFSQEPGSTPVLGFVHEQGQGKLDILLSEKHELFRIH